MRKVFFLFMLLLCLTLIKPVPESDLSRQIGQKVLNVQQGLQHEETAKKVELKTPDDQVFAINNIQINQTKNEVEKKLGKPKRITANEYNEKWHVYHNDYQEFVMVSYDHDKVTGLYTNQDLITSKKGITSKMNKDKVRSILGEPEKAIEKDKVKLIQNDEDYDVFKFDNIYTTVFYDKHENNQIKGIMQIASSTEDKRTNQYHAASDEYKKALELQNFDLVNAERVQFGLPTLAYNERVSETARKHSQDMVNNDYFDHNNKQGMSPFDRLDRDGFNYVTAGENLAYGQISSIYAHHGLMNSLGHRKNILNKDYKELGVGVDIGEELQPYWTENYITQQ
ncbi:CAP domain-containing protein [Mammaliicoccus sciuri]|uniref:CAP domain-containing protein n=1 Tax=Mammaliicoccus sciuri TaxID=1296 RepID=UPI002DBCBC8C|nr:CAP domain-containing protein [Mammaliicoccus sciuri]MEB7066063.1 CAP domain-containing protein [Mammaliicoccus sciuri]